MIPSPTDAAERFDRLWREGHLPSVQDFLATAGHLAPAEVVAVLSVDQQYRWRRGERVGVESYLQACPALAGDDRTLELICREFWLRETSGETPSLEEYVQRFPAYAGRLQQQIELYRGLASSVLLRRGSVDATLGQSLPGSERLEGLADNPNCPAIPDYEILGMLGRGAMGVVYRARQLGLNRVVALKMILGGAYANPATLARFRLEVETLARLQHPNIVQIYAVGQHEGHVFCVLEYVDGGDLTKMLAGAPQPARQAAHLTKLLALAVHCVHEHGIIHRDLKPANVLLTTQRIPKISDFGLAKQLDLTARQTQSGDVLGTPSYMAPEQAGGRMNEVGPATDVYALGAMLYEMLTGRPPFAAKSWFEALQEIQNSPPLPPSRLQPRVPRDLETICLKCLEKGPTQRYASAAALAKDLEAFLAGDPIEGRLAGYGVRTADWVRRQPTAAVMIGAGIVASLGLLVGIWWYNPLAVGAIAVLSLLGGAWWYHGRLRMAFRELDRQEALAERSVERVHLLLETTRRLMDTTDVDTLLRLLTETTTGIANAERATVYLIDASRRELWSKVALGENLHTIRMPLGVGIAGTVAVTGETINIPDAYADDRFNPDIDRATGYRTRNILAFPMRGRDGRVLGVFQVLNKRVGVFDAEDVGLLGALAASAAMSVENASHPSDRPGGRPGEEQMSR